MRDYRFFSQARRAEIIYDADFTPLYGQQDAIIGAVCILHDTTERHRMEHLSRLETVAQLTGGVAHDFNNLLTAAMGSLDMIAHRAADARTSSLAETALRSISRGAQLTQQLLTFSRRQALHPVAADLNGLLSEIEVLIRRALGETIELVIDCTAGLPRCRVDPAQFEAAVMNLVMNARDAMPRGGRLMLSTRSISAGDDIALDEPLAPGEYLELAVADNGEGMSAAVAARAFEPFYTTKEVGKGSGLGLSTVYGFARQSGGGATLASTPGEGTKVVLYLPASSSPRERPAEDPARASPQRGSGAVLVVEDDDSVREVSVEILQELGYRTLVARSGKEAMEVLVSPEPIDLLFTDLVMPGGLSGTALARQAQALRPGLAVLLTTGYALREGPGTSEFPMLVKPFRAQELSRTVGRLLNSLE
jgi:signal transduction histidine kinase/CheY-like chemotaxis protein